MTTPTTPEALREQMEQVLDNGSCVWMPHMREQVISEVLPLALAYAEAREQATWLTAAEMARDVENQLVASAQSLKGQSEDVPIEMALGAAAYKLNELAETLTKAAERTTP